jgi:hypothetical protein
MLSFPRQQLTVLAFLAAMVSSAQSPVPASRRPGEIQISRGIADKLLVHKEEIVCKQHGMSAHVTGTVVVAIEINRTGKVSFAKAISGPAMLIPPALKAVRKYQYKPYTLNNKPVSVKTTVAIPFECPNQ